MALWVGYGVDVSARARALPLWFYNTSVCLFGIFYESCYIYPIIPIMQFSLLYDFWKVLKLILKSSIFGECVYELILCVTNDNWVGIVLDYIRYVWPKIIIWLRELFMKPACWFSHTYMPHVGLYMRRFLFLLLIETIIVHRSYFTHTRNSLTRVICFIILGSVWGLWLQVRLRGL